jgi:hypothetical protein
VTTKQKPRRGGAFVRARRDSNSRPSVRIFTSGAQLLWLLAFSQLAEIARGHIAEVGTHLWGHVLASSHDRRLRPQLGVGAPTSIIAVK